MLFEELMMQNRFAVIRDVAITNQPSGDNVTASDYIVTWGQRGRIGDDKLTNRVLFSASRVLPEFDSQAALKLVPAPIAMVSGNNWLDNLTISPVEPIMSRLKTAQVKGLAMPTSFIEPSSAKPATRPLTLPLNNFNRYYQKPLPKH